MADGKPKKIRWSKQAERQLREILEFYLERNRSPSYGEALKARVARQLRRILTFPESGELLDNRSARFVVVGPFVLVYEIIDDVIVVQTFRDGRRRPER